MLPKLWDLHIFCGKLCKVEIFSAKLSNLQIFCIMLCNLQIFPAKQSVLLWQALQSANFICQSLWMTYNFISDKFRIPQTFSYQLYYLKLFFFSGKLCNLRNISSEHFNLKNCFDKPRGLHIFSAKLCKLKVIIYAAFPNS